MIKLNIKDKLTEKGLNKNQFSKLIQIGYPATCAIYDGETTKISFDTLERICKVLECTPNDIIVSDDPFLKRMLAYRCGLNKIINEAEESDTN